MTKTTHPTTIPTIDDALSLPPVEGEIVDGENDNVGIGVGLTVGDVGDSVGNDVGTIGYSQLQAIELEPLSL